MLIRIGSNFERIIRLEKGHQRHPTLLGKMRRTYVKDLAVTDDAVAGLWHRLCASCIEKGRQNDEELLGDSLFCSA